MRALALLVAPTLLTACAPEPGVAELTDRALRDLISGHVTETAIAHELYDLGDVAIDADVTPASCDLVDAKLNELCNELQADGQAYGCGMTTAFHHAHAIPRCAVRFAIASDPNDRIVRLYALDASGAPLGEPEPLCGNGRLDTDAGEECDDGNLELWDGCDSTCRTEEFEGCEAVIEQRYQLAGLAFVDRTTWQGKRSQLMINDASALRPITAAACDEAGRIGRDVCTELRAQMPFVSDCAPRWELHDEGGAPACSVRFDVWFSGRDPDAGVYTTALTGELAFTIR